MVERRILVPSQFQIFVWNFPSMPRSDRTAALEFKVRASVPLPRERYRPWSSWFRHGRGWRVVVAVVKEPEGGGIPGAGPPVPLYLPFPYRVRGNLHQTRRYQIDGQSVVVEYRAGVVEGIESLGAEATVPGDRDATKEPNLIRLGTEQRRGVRWWAPTLGVLGLVMFGAAGAKITLEKQQELELWRTWVAEEARSRPAPPPSLEEWRSRAGFPLLKVTQALAQAWGNSVRIHALSSKGRVLSLEAEGDSALRAATALESVPGLEQVRLIKTRLLHGKEHFVLEGEVTLDP